MKKKKSGGGGANWMDTYGDMVTLLLCFFVLLYSMSTITEDKWKAIVQSFNPSAVPTPTEIDGGNKGPIADPTEDQNPGMSEIEKAQQEIDNMIEQLYQAMMDYRAAEGLENTLSVSKEGGRVFVRFDTTTFFNGDSAVLRPEAYPILDHVSAVISQAADAIDEVEVQGHTARVDPARPNNVANDRKLASDRALNVEVYIQMNSTLDPARLTSKQYGEWVPVAPNDTEEGRAQNRRVELVISGRDLLSEMPDDIQSFDTSTAGGSSEGSAGN